MKARKVARYEVGPVDVTVALPMWEATMDHLAGVCRGHIKIGSNQAPHLRYQMSMKLGLIYQTYNSTQKTESRRNKLV